MSITDQHHLWSSNLQSVAEDTKYARNSMKCLQLKNLLFIQDYLNEENWQLILLLIICSNVNLEC